MEKLRDGPAAQHSADIEQMPELHRFAPCIGESFAVCSAQGPLLIELVEAKALPGHAGVAYEGSFSLIFRAASDCGLAQGSVAVEHAKVGWVVMYLVPIGEDQDGQYFEAVFN